MGWLQRWSSVAVLAALFAPHAPAVAQAAPQQYVVIYGELRSDAVSHRDGELLLNYLAQTALKSQGVQYFKFNNEIERPNFFTLIGVWRDAASYIAFAGNARTQEVLTYLKPLLLAPLDERDGNLVQ